MNTKAASRGNLITLSGIFVGLLIAIITVSYTSYSDGQDEQDTSISENSAAIQKTCIDIAEMRKDIEHIKEDGTESKETQQKILDKLDDLKDAIRDDG